MQIDKVASVIGLAMKAGKVVSGEFQTEKAVKSRKAYLVVLAGDASDNTKKKFKDMCSYYHTPYCIWGDRELLGQAIGREFRASLAVTDKNLAEVVKRTLI